MSLIEGDAPRLSLCRSRFPILEGCLATPLRQCIHFDSLGMASFPPVLKLDMFIE
jgi:hypothetical protein